MSRTHPPTLITITERTIREHALIARGEKVLVAVSGGPDSMALLHVLARVRSSKLGFAIVAHAIDHGLREDAPREIDLARTLARDLDVPFASSRVSVARGGNLQARARTARYAALHIAAASNGATRIATAHHANDRAETFLLRMLRGAGPRGLAVMPPIESRTTVSPIPLIRPFLFAQRDAILAHIARHTIPFANDPSNCDPRFLRARVRHELLPLLAQLNPSIVTHLSVLADQLAALDIASSTFDITPAPSLARLTPSLEKKSPVARQTREALESLRRSRSPRARVRLPGGNVARYDAQTGITVEREDPKSRTRRSGS